MGFGGGTGKLALPIPRFTKAERAAQAEVQELLLEQLRLEAERLVEAAQLATEISASLLTMAVVEQPKPAGGTSSVLWHWRRLELVWFQQDFIEYVSALDELIPDNQWDALLCASGAIAC